MAEARVQRAVLVGVPWGGLVQVGDRWGVVCQVPPELRKLHVRRAHRVIDFWDGGREWVSHRTNVLWQTDTGGGWEI